MQEARSRSVVAFVTLLSLLTVSGFAQSLDPATAERFEIEPKDFGTTSSSYLLIPATDFRPTNSAWTYETLHPDTFSFEISGYGDFSHRLDIPNGSLLESLRLYYYDADPSENVFLFFCRAWVETNTGLNPGADYVTAFSTGSAGNGSILLNVNQTIQTLSNVDGDPAIEEIRYFVIVRMLSGGMHFHRFSGLRAQFKRQVTPAPATATFPNDVPTTHPFYQFIEALAAAGITAGCGPGSYCPDSPLTRGQMAVFLSRALGLHWTP